MLKDNGVLHVIKHNAIPMFFDLPAIQTFFPYVGMLHRLMISRTPRGVAGIKVPSGSPAQYLPMLW